MQITNRLREVASLTQKAYESFAVNTIDGLVVVAVLATASEPMSMTTLRKLSGVSTTSGKLTHIVDRLEKSGLVVRQQLKSDRRVITVEKTQSLTNKYQKWEHIFNSRIPA